ncbi:MAG: GNAT family N-acetyltransferase [Pseudomonadota bacterium]|nr:GNAT family N-acetyltransferase [Pseudomonadota bacterium]
MALEVVGTAAAGVLAALHGRCFDPGWSEPDMREVLAMPGTLALVAGGDSPSGFAILRAVADEAEIITVGVLPACRGGRIGEALLRAAVALLPDVAAVFLEVETGNDSAISLYRRLGFREVGRRRGYYRDATGTVRDALVLRATVPLSCP